MSVILEDASGILWNVSATATGEITATSTGAGTTAAVYLNDPGVQTSWLLTIGIGGAPITADPVPLNTSYPTSLSLSSSFNLVITNQGELNTVPSTLPVPKAAAQLSRAAGATTSGQIIPVSSSPNQSFSSTVQVDGKPMTLNFTITWNAMAGYWVMSVSDASDNLLLDSIPLITGWYPAANLLAQYGYLEIGSAFILNDGNNNSDYPGQSDLGTSFSLLWSDSA